MKRMKKTLSVLLAALMVAGLLVGCGGDASSAGNSTPASTPAGEPAGEPAGTDGEEENLRYDDTQFISMFTSSPGGDMYNMAAAMAPIWEEKLNVVASIGPGGSLSNYNALATGDCDIGFDHQCMHYWGERAEGPFDEVVDGMSYMAILFPATVQCFSTTNNTTVQNVADLNGKRVGFGAVGSALNVFLEDYLSVMYGITQETIVAAGGSVSYMSDAEMTSALQDGIIDVGFALGTYPKTSLQELENNPGLRLISFGDDLYTYLETNTGWTTIEIPAGTYSGQDEPYVTATSWAIMSMSNDMDEELVYRLTRVTWENIEEAGEACVAIRNFMKLENTLEPMNGAALHPGAERYYREIGMLS